MTSSAGKGRFLDREISFGGDFQIDTSRLTPVIVRNFIQRTAKNVLGKHSRGIHFEHGRTASNTQKKEWLAYPRD